MICRTSLVFPTDPKSASSVTFLYMLFSPLYRSLMKRLNKTRSAPHSRANDKGVGGAEELPVHQPVAQEGCKVMQQPSARPLLSRVHGHLSPPFVYDFSARFQVLRVWSHPSPHAVLCQVALRSSRKIQKNLFTAFNSA